MSDCRIVSNGEGLVEPACMNALSLVAFPSMHTTSFSFRAVRPSELSWSSPIILADEQRPREGPELTLQHTGSQPKARTNTSVSMFIGSYSLDNTMPICPPFNLTAVS